MKFMFCRTRPLGGSLLAGAVALTIIGASLMGTSPAVAQDAQTACTPDVMNLCSQFINPPDKQKISACLFRNRARLSPECGKFMQPRRKGHR